MFLLYKDASPLLLCVGANAIYMYFFISNAQ